jgi:hypothetical protein
MSAPIRRAAVVCASFALLGAAEVVCAQGSTDEALTQAISFYENLDVERALVLLRRVVSPSSPFEVSPHQRVRAYTYLAATLAIVGQKDSAVVYFRAALERDPFIDLDPERFTPQEQAALAEAKRQTFAIGARPLPPAEWDPTREQVTFTLVTTHSATLRVELHPLDGGQPVVLYEREGNGVREITWNGMLGGRLAPAGAYELCIVGRSAITERVDSTRTPFGIEHRHEALEDTLPDLAPSDLLPERRPPNAGRTAMWKALSIAGAAVIVPALVGNADLRDGGSGLGITAATAAAAAGVAVYIIHRRSPEIPGHIAQNAALRVKRTAANAAIARRNADRLARTRVTLIPGAAR